MSGYQGSRQDVLKVESVIFSTHMFEIFDGSSKTFHRVSECEWGGGSGLCFPLLPALTERPAGGD